MTLHPLRTGTALADVLDERDRQDAKWGEQNHALPLWLAILDEEVGEFATAILQRTFDTKDTKGGGLDATEAMKRCREEAVQIAAVAVAIVEFIDRWAGYWTEKA